MTQQFENFVNAALDKSLSSDVTLPTADEIPVFTGIGRQVTGKTIAELGLALTTDLGTAAAADVGDFEANLGYTPEDQNNKDTDGTLADNSDTKYPSQKAVKTYADTKQAADATLTALAAFNSNGVMVQTAADTFTSCTITGTDGQVTVTNGDGVAGNPTVSLPASGVTAETYGSATQVPVTTYNAQGIATSVTLATIETPTTFSDSDFRIQDNGDATKQIAFEASGITTSTTRTVTMPDANVDLGGVRPLVFVSSTITAVHKGNYATVYALGSNITINVPPSVDGNYFDLFLDYFSGRTITLQSTLANMSGASTTFVLDTRYRFSTLRVKYEAAAGIWLVRPIARGQSITLGSSTVFISNDNQDSQMTFQMSAVTGGRTVTFPDVPTLDFGNLSWVATTNSNVLGGTDCRIEGGTNNNVSGTGCETINCFYTTLSGTRNTAINCGESGSAFTGSGTENTFINCRATTQGSGSTHCTYENLWNTSILVDNTIFPEGTKIVGNGLTYTTDSILTGTHTGATSIQLLGGGYAPLSIRPIVGGYEAAFHEIDIMGTDISTPFMAMIGRRHVAVLTNNLGGNIFDVTTVGTDGVKNGATYTITITEVSGRLSIVCSMTSAAGGDTVIWRCRVRSTYI